MLVDKKNHIGFQLVIRACISSQEYIADVTEPMLFLQVLFLITDWWNKFQLGVLILSMAE